MITDCTNEAQHGKPGIGKRHDQVEGVGQAETAERREDRIGGGVRLRQVDQRAT